MSTISICTISTVLMFQCRSRTLLGADCQQVSQVIGNDLNMILRNVLQGTGAMIYLLILSWPLGLSILVICFTLAAIMLIYGRYQKKAAKLTQEFTASANEVAQETFSLVRTVRVYGTEKQELGRCRSYRVASFISLLDFGICCYNICRHVNCEMKLVEPLGVIIVGISDQVL